jgi:hypothetical protein
MKVARTPTLSRTSGQIPNHYKNDEYETIDEYEKNIKQEREEKVTKTELIT